MPSVNSVGKPRLFFKNNDQDQEWRLKEKIVAIIESYYHGIDVFAFSPANIPNIVGDSTEVDVVFSNLPDPTNFIDFIQVRDRGETQGRPWIEQVMGQRRSLNNDQGLMVSTSSFSAPAIRLAKNQNIPLRLLLPESDENIRYWFSSNELGLQNPLLKLLETKIIGIINETKFEFSADEKKSHENNILIPTTEPNKYSLISLRRVLDIEIYNNPDRSDEIIGQLSKDNIYQNMVLSIEYSNPCLFIEFDGIVNGKEEMEKKTIPIVGIVFRLLANRNLLLFPITHRFKYINAIDGSLLAQAIVAEINVHNKKYYSCLVRHKTDKDYVEISGGFFK